MLSRMPKQNTSRGTARMARFITVMFFLVGVLATIATTRMSARRHHAEAMRVFAAECAAMRSAVSRQLDLFFDVLASIGKLHELSDRITPEDFEEFSSKGLLFQRRILSAYGFVQRMPHEIRDALMNRPDGGLRIVEPDSSGNFVAAGDRPEYFPLVYQNPEGALALPLGADIATLPGMPETIITMNNLSRPVIAQSLRLQGAGAQSGYFVFSPLMQTTSDGETGLTGFTMSILWPHEILNRALADIATRDVLVRFYDPQVVSNADDNISASVLQMSSDIAVADRTWRFHAVASPEYMEAHASALPNVIAVTGGIITLLATATMLLLTSRTEKIEHVVAERTRELKNANDLLSEAMHERMRLESEILDISEREKQQFGHDLHDSLGQKLTGAVFLSRALAGRLNEQHDAETKTQATRITEVLKESVAQVRRMARGLSPVDLGQEGLAGALQRLADETSAVYGITCLFHQAEEHPEPSPKAARHLYAIAQEAVSNAVKHGHAKEIVIEMSRRGGANNLLIIEDDGSGFDADTTQSGGMGLRIMKYRATMIGGSLEITRRAVSGMQVLCAFPPGSPV